MMAKTFVVSDSHFGHAKISEYAKRPFDSVEEMDEFMIAAWNETVEYQDVVYHLGDFCLGDLEMATGYFERLNGKIFVLGNDFHHDKRWLKEYNKTSDFDWVMSKSGWTVFVVPPIQVLKAKWYGLSKPIVLCHFEMASWPQSHFGSWHFYGHDHVTFAPFGQKMNVGVDAHGFRPLDIAVLAKHLENEGY